MKIKSIGKAAAALRGKAGALLFLGSPRRRAAVLAGISRQIRVLVPARCGRHETAPSGRAAVFSRPPDHGKRATATLAGRAATALQSAWPSWRECSRRSTRTATEADTRTGRSPFHDEEEPRCDIGGLEDDDEPSVIDLIRNRREGEGREFRIDDEIDHAAGMFITRVRRRWMAAQPVLL
jgi:hypothetical protein